MEELHYDQLAKFEETHWWHLARQKIIVDFLRFNFEKLKIGKDAKLLDVGCGTGKMLSLLKTLVDPVGVDYSPKAIEYCKMKGAGTATLANGSTLPFLDGSFDVLSAQEVLEHIKDDGSALREWGRVLKPNGVLFLTVPAYQWMWGPADKYALHFRRYTLKRLKKLLEENGYNITKASYFNTLLFPGIAGIRVARKPFINLDTMSATDMEKAFDFNIGPKFLNGPLAWIFGLERFLLRWFYLPYGVSIILIARKK